MAKAEDDERKLLEDFRTGKTMRLIFLASPQINKSHSFLELSRSLSVVRLVRYSSPNSMMPLQGVLAACAVRNLAPYVANYVFKREDGYKVEPPNEIFAPPLTQYVFNPFTGAILSKQINSGEDKEKKEEKEKKPPTKKKEGDPPEKVG